QQRRRQGKQEHLFEPRTHPRKISKPESDLLNKHRRHSDPFFGFLSDVDIRLSVFYCVPCAVANSRRVKTVMPNKPRIPPRSKTTWPKALVNSSQVMLRPLLSESIGEKFRARLMTPRIALKVGITTTSTDEEPLVPFSAL